MLAALLAIVGYSLNDTIIIYDRIRENLELHPRRARRRAQPPRQPDHVAHDPDLGHDVLSCLALPVPGRTVIFPFSFTMLIGIVVGTYSSIFIAAPILLFLEQRPATARA